MSITWTARYSTWLRIMSPKQNILQSHFLNSTKLASIDGENCRRSEINKYEMRKKSCQNQFCCYFSRSPEYRSLAISFFSLRFSFVHFFSISESCFSFTLSISMAFVTCVFTFFLFNAHSFWFFLFRFVWFGWSRLTRTTVEVPAFLYARTVQLL